MIAKYVDDTLDKKDFPFLEFSYNDPKDYQYLIQKPEIRGVFYSGSTEEGKKIA